MFKRKKKEEYKEPAKPSPRILKEWEDLRLVESFWPQYDYIKRSDETKSRIIGYTSVLTLEVKDKNAMEEPFWVRCKREHSDDQFTNEFVFKIIRRLLNVQ